jgi:Arc/MetJ family transcription regulator
MCMVLSYSTHKHTPSRGLPMRTNIEIDDTLMAEAQKVSGHTTKKQTVEEALRLMIRLRRQREVGAAFGKYRWRGNLAESRKGRGIG